MSQPAMSHALRRLREMFDDELFVRTSSGMVPTRRADEIAARVAETLEQLEQILTNDRSFSPSKAKRTFRIGTNDYSALLLLPRVCVEVANQAPSIEIRVTQERGGPFGGAADSTWYERIESGGLDLALIGSDQHPPQFESELLISEDAVCIVSKNNTLVGEEIDMDTFLSLRHVKLYFTSEESKSWIDIFLEQQGVQRKVVATMSCFAAAAHAVADSNLVATMPAHIAETFESLYGLRVLSPPFPQQPANRIYQAWHRRSTNDRGHQWLREVVRQCSSD